MEKELAPLLDLLNGRRFTAGDICLAADIEPKTLANYIHKTSVQLASQSRGQGKSREYCLIDVYAMAFFDRIAKRTNDIHLAAKLVNSLLYDELELDLLDGKGPFTGHPQARKSFCEDIRWAPSYFQHRDVKNPRYAFQDEQGGLIVSDRVIVDPLHGTVVVNLTALLAHVDTVLVRLKGLIATESETRQMLAKAMSEGLRPPPPPSKGKKAGDDA